MMNPIMIAQAAFSFAMLSLASSSAGAEKRAVFIGVSEGYASYYSGRDDFAGAFAGFTVSRTMSGETSLLGRVIHSSLYSGSDASMRMTIPSFGFRFVVDASPIEPYVTMTAGYYLLRSRKSSLDRSGTGLGIGFGVSHSRSSFRLSVEAEYHTLSLRGEDISTLETYPLFTAGTRIEFGL